ncbi:hypothetical protein JB92DRAFT_3123441 [Gautieria morchelliformis]|nr:hypothetical protein JB92DRAFT_3123441 [Gautieria morchelliformis]
MQRKDTEVLHEPFGEPYYYGPERLSKRYSQAQCAASNAKDVTYSDIHHLIMQAQESAAGKLIVVKDMAQYIVRPERISASPRVNPTVIPDTDLKKFRHTFLMRDPQKTIPSYYRATKGDCGDFGEFDPNEAGFAELQTLMEYIKRLLPDDRLVLLDSADLISEPERALRLFCDGVGIPFEECMLSWERKHVSSFDKWKGFHDQAQNSTGFQEIPHEKEEVNLPQSITDAIERNMPIYESLQEVKLKV